MSNTWAREHWTNDLSFFNKFIIIFVKNKLGILICNVIIFIVIVDFKFKIFFTTFNLLVLKYAKTLI